MKTQEERKIFRRMISDEQLPILQALNEIGVQISSVRQLTNSRVEYDQAVPVLIEHFHKPYHYVIRADIAYALCRIRGNDEVRKFMLEEIQKPHEDLVLGALSQGTEELATKEDVPLLKSLLSEPPSLREFRGGLILALERLIKQEAIPLILPFLDDPVPRNVGDAIDALGRLRAYEAIDKLEALKEHKDSYVREKARRALKKLT